MRQLQVIKEIISLLFKTKPWKKNEFASRENAIFFRKSFEKLGSVYIKLGQMLALRPDYIPVEFCNEFYKLLDQVPSFDPLVAQNILKEQLGDNSLFIDKLEERPAASASFAQVHKAKLKSGRIVAIKIQRPNIGLVVKEDIKSLKFIAKILDLIFQPANKFANILNEFEAWTSDELDYVKEAENIMRFNDIATLIGDGIRGPEVYSTLSTQKVLTMEFIEGLSLNQIIHEIKGKKKKYLEEIGFSGKPVINNIIKNVLETSHVHGFFHGDPHPANIIFTPDKKLVFIDFGIVGSLTKKDRVLLLKHFRTLLSGDVDGSFDSLLALCGDNEPKNLNQIKNKYRVLVNKITDTFDSKTYLEQQQKSGPYLTKMLNLMQTNGMKVPIGIVRYFKAFETVEGLIFALYPELQVKAMLKEFRRVSIINIIDSLPDSVNKEDFDRLVFKLIDSIESSIILKD